MSCCRGPFARLGGGALLEVFGGLRLVSPYQTIIDHIRRVRSSEEDMGALQRVHSGTSS